MGGVRKSNCERTIEDIDTVIRYMDYFDYGFSKKGLEKRKKKLTKLQKTLQKKIEEDDFDD